MTLATKALTQFNQCEKFEGYMKTVQKALNWWALHEKIDPSKGLKVKAFHRNLLLDLEPVTVDRWIGRAWGLKHNPSSLASYNQIASTIRRVSWQMRDPMTGHRPAKPAQIQAAIWRGIQKEHGVETDDVAQLINQSQWGSVQWR